MACIGVFWWISYNEIETLYKTQIVESKGLFPHVVVCAESADGQCEEYGHCREGPIAYIEQGVVVVHSRFGIFLFKIYLKSNRCVTFHNVAGERTRMFVLDTSMWQS